MELATKKPEKIRLVEINPYLTCYLCKGYFIDATTISECLHSFCRSCIIKFLQENSYCPVCEVIINKAKPNLKLDKTLQDIVYKLVPELFTMEMNRRKKFYQKYPEIAAKTSPEDKGEDTERTIFNPQDSISLSMEYVRDDSTPGAIRIPPLTTETEENQQDALLKRYLQCPGMCRIEVLKKFVRNKYNVNTNLFYIDILYKRVPLPEHYTLIDIAYIYSWKRNEPMKLLFRITDVTKVQERFDYFNAANVPEQLQFIPKTTTTRSSNRNTGDKVNNATKKRDSIAAQTKGTNKLTVKETSRKKKLESDGINNKICDTKSVQDTTSKLNGSAVVSATSENIEPELKEQIKNQLKNDTNPKVYTNITLNRPNNVEIITKIQKVSNKDGQPIGFNIMKQIKKGGSSRVSLGSNKGALKADHTANGETKSECDNHKNDTTEVSVEDEKSYFFKSIELTAKNSIVTNKPINSGQKRKNSSPIKNDKPTKKAKVERKTSTKLSASPKTTNSAPNNKNAAVTSATVKPGNNNKNSEQCFSNGLQSLINSCKLNIPSSLSITIKESKDMQSPVIAPVQNFIEILKLPEENKEQPKADNKDGKDEVVALSKIDVNHDTNMKSPCDNDSEQKVDEDLSEIAKSLTEKIPISTTVSQAIGPKPQFSIPIKTNVPATFLIQPAPVPEVPCKLLNMTKENLPKLNPRSAQTFQRIFEESIKKPDGSPESPPSGQKRALDLSNEINTPTNNNVGCKKNILEIASQLYKKTKMEQEKNQVDSVPVLFSASMGGTLPKVAIPRLPNLRNTKQPQKLTNNIKPPAVETLETKLPQTVTNLHSTSLGLNYSVSVNSLPLGSPTKTNGIISPTKTDSLTIAPESKPDSPTSIDDSPKKLVMNIESPNRLDSPSPKTIKEQNPLKIDTSSSPKTTPMSVRTSPNMNSPKLSPKSSPAVKHMYAPMVMVGDQKLHYSPYSQKIPSPKLTNMISPPFNKSPKLSSPPPVNKSPKIISPSNKLPKHSPQSTVNKSPKLISPRVSPSTVTKSNNAAGSSPLSSNQLLEKYNIQNLAQLSASLNFNAAGFGLNPSNSLASFQHAMLLKHIEMQNRQNWLTMNQGHPILQYEKFLQSLTSNQNHLLSNIKEN